MVDKSEVLATLNRLEIDLADTYAIVGTMKDFLNDTLTENTQLRLENDRLRARLDELENPSKVVDRLVSLQKIYDEGFHVCRTYYGKVLEDGENCLLCQEVLS
ncbi:MAG: initiation control protein YabA [Streptococcaceae bacterium]|jgi:regulator of replication initiation timing|nr:initiation control protein YabA [Streptococcaceae bacterium]